MRSLPSNRLDSLNSVVARINPHYCGLNQSASARFFDLLQQRGAHATVLSLFEDFRLTGQLDAGDGVIFNEAQIIKLNEFFDKKNDLGLLVVGCCQDYAPILLNVRTSEIGVLPPSCDEGDRLRVRHSLEVVGSNLVEFLWHCNFESRRRRFHIRPYIVPYKFNTDFHRILNSFCSQGHGSYSAATQDFSTWVHSKNLPPKLDALFQWFMPTSEIMAGTGWIGDAHFIMASNDLWKMLACGFLIMGTCPDGDFIVIDFHSRTLATGYITHEEVSPACDFRKYYVPIAPAWSYFFHDANLLGYLADDYYQAKALLCPDK